MATIRLTRKARRKPGRSTRFAGNFGRNLPIVAASAFAGVVLLFGGASRIDSLAQIPVGIFSAAMVGIAIAVSQPGQFSPYRKLLWFLAAIAALMAIQMIPLPPALWSELPGRKVYLQAAVVAGMVQPWRPISISPDLTWASLMGMCTPFAAVLAIGLIGRGRSRVILSILLIVGLASIVLGLAQLGGGPDSALRYYAQTNSEAPVGFFANRNHYGFFLALMVPLLAIWARQVRPADIGRRGAATDNSRYRPMIALAYFALLVPMILLSGSRAALLLIVLLLGPSVLLFMEGQKIQLNRRNALYAAAGALLVAATVAATILAARATAVARIVEADPAGDIRARYIGPSITAMKAFFPFGSGFGTFDPAFRRFEPSAILDRKYANHAHNEFLELPIEAGVFAIVLGAGFLVWWTVASWRIWIAAGQRGRDDLACIGSLITGALLLASIVDYPLRTPLLASLFMAAAAWMISARSYTRASAAGGK